jgi:hypothetical protein
VNKDRQPDTFALVCDGSSGDKDAELRMASSLHIMFNAWKRHKLPQAIPWAWTMTQKQIAHYNEPRNR